MLNFIIPVALNYSQGDHQKTSRADKRKKKLSAIATLTFSALAEKMNQRAKDGEVSESSLANLHSALKSFLAANGLSEQSLVGSFLRASYYRNLGEHVEQLQAAGRTSSYIANRKSLLGKWHSLVNQLDRLDAIANNSHTPFQLALQELLETSKTNIASLAKVLGMHKGTLRSWVLGAQPKRTALPALRRMESLFAMQPNALVSLAFERNYYKPVDEVPDAEIAYRMRLAANSKDTYVLKTVSPTLSREWADLLVHKTERLPILKRQTRGSWVVSEFYTQGKTEKNSHFFVKDRYVPTSKIVWNLIFAYLGWLCRSQDAGGAGLCVDEIQSLAWLTNKPMIHRYLSWRIERSDDKVHTGILGFIRQVKALTHPEHGYLTQMPNLNGHLPEQYQHASWKDACQEAFEWSSAMAKNLIARGIEKSREPMQPIMQILQLGDPMSAIGDMTARMRACRPVTGGVEEAIWARDLLLVRLMASNPLRAKNLKLLTYKADNTGNLYKKADGSWNIRIDKKAFKNVNGAAGEEDYDVGVTENVWPAIDQYLMAYRPMLPDADKVDFVFLSSSTEKKAGYVGPWTSLNRRIFYLTKRYLWNCPGIGSHGMRYIVGTAILKKRPDAWGLAAAALHDKEETVRAHYAHLKARDKVANAHQSLKEFYDRI